MNSQKPQTQPAHRRERVIVRPILAAVRRLCAAALGLGARPIPAAGLGLCAAALVLAAGGLSRAAGGPAPTAQAQDDSAGTAQHVRGAAVATSSSLSRSASKNTPTRKTLPARAGVPGTTARSVDLGPLADPSAVAVSSNGTIFVCEARADRVSVFSSKGTLLRRWGRSGDAPGELRAPRGIAVAPDGRLYVSDSGNHRIQVFTPAGLFVKSWGRYGAGAGEFRDPAGLAADAERVYLADSRNNRIQVFDHEGTFLFYVWSHGYRNGQLDRPVGVAASGQGTFSVCDQGNSRVEQFDREGSFVRAWGGWGSYPGLLAEPGGIALDPSNSLLVADTQNHRVQAFDSAGRPLGSWRPSAARAGAAGAAHALSAQPRAEGAASTHSDAAGTDGSGARGATRGTGVPVRGEHDAGRKTERTDPGETTDSPEPLPFEPAAVAWLPGGDRFVVCDAFSERCSLEPARWNAAPEPAPTPIAAARHAAGLDGETLGVTTGRGALLLLDLSSEPPRPLAIFGGHGREAMEFVRPAGLAYSAASAMVYVSDPGSYRLASFRLGAPVGTPLRFDSLATRFVRSVSLDDEESAMLWPGRWPLDPFPVEPGPIARDAQGRLLLIDTLTSRIVTFDPDLKPLGAWGRRGTKDGEFLAPADLVLDASGKSVYVLDTARARVQVFDRAGRLLSAWGGRAPARPDLSGAAGLAVAADGEVLIADRDANRIRRFSRAGQPLGVWGKTGTAHGELRRPERVFVDGRGRILVVDLGWRRLQAFTRAGRVLWNLDIEAAAASARNEALLIARGELPGEARTAPEAEQRAGSGPTSASSADFGADSPLEAGALHSPRPAPDVAASARAAAARGLGASPGAKARGSSAADSTAAPFPDCRSSGALGIRSNDDRYLVCYRTSPDPIPLNQSFAIDVWIRLAEHPARLADTVALSVEASMPAHGHGLIELPTIRTEGAAPPQDSAAKNSGGSGALPPGVDPTGIPPGGHGVPGNGRFIVQGVRFHMPGRWELYFDITHGAATERAQVQVDLD